MFFVSGLVSNGITVYRRFRGRGANDVEAVAEEDAEADAPYAERTRCDPEAMPGVEAVGAHGKLKGTGEESALGTVKKSEDIAKDG